MDVLAGPPWADATQFISHAQAAHISRGILGLCPLDVEPHNILQCSGFYSLEAAQRDLEGSLPAAVVGCILERCRQLAVPEAFMVRQELVQLKKMFLILAQEAAHVERQLKRLCVFHYCDLLRTPAEAPEHQRYVHLSCLLSRLKGMLLAVTDARTFTKWICSVPRHPEGDAGGSWVPGRVERSAALPGLTASNSEASDPVSPRTPPAAADPAVPEPLRALPHSLGVARALERAEAWIRSHTGESGAVATTSLPSIIPSQDHTNTTAAILAPFAAQVPAHILAYTEKVFIARGVSKVLRIVDLVARLEASLEWVGARLPAALTALRAFQPAPGVLSDRIHHAMHLHTLEGIADVNREVLRWLAVIQRPLRSPGQGPHRPAFRIGDPGPANHSADFLPQDFQLPQLLAEVRQAVAPLWDNMVAAFSDHGDQCLPQRHLSGSTPCTVCARPINKVWVNRGVCLRCETTARAEGRCPFRSSCDRRAFCPHAAKCFVCDLWSCEACALWRGDGELVMELVEQLRPGAVFLDFDRTVASTRSGGDPLAGQHTVDPLLVALCCAHPNVHIVTRNPHLDSMRAFLTAHGAPATLPIHVVGARRGGEKAAVVAAHAAGGAPLLFVDDDIREHCRPAMLALRPALHRVLFARGV